jgi:hypothetical protein
MKLRWIYLGLLIAVAIPTSMFQQMGTTEVASHSFFHLFFAVGISAPLWFIRRPMSATNRWLMRAGWGISAAQWIEALGAFGYDDGATSAVPGLQLLHNMVAPAVFSGSLMLLVGAGVAAGWPRLSGVARVILATVAAGGGLVFLSTLVGIGS